MKFIKVRNLNEAIENVTEFAKDNQGTAPITMAHAVRVSAEKDKKIDKALKPKQKEVDELVKENERNAHKVPKTSDLKKMHLSEDGTRKVSKEVRMERLERRIESLLERADKYEAKADRFWDKGNEAGYDYWSEQADELRREADMLKVEYARLEKGEITEAKKSRYIDLVDEIDAQLTMGGPQYFVNGSPRVNFGAGYDIDQIGTSYHRYDKEKLIGITVEVDPRKVDNPKYKTYLGDLQPARDIAARYEDLGVTTTERQVVNSTKPLTKSTILTIWVPDGAPAADRDPKFAKPEKKKELVPVGEAMISTDKDLAEHAQSIATEIEEFLNETTKIENLENYLDEYDIEHISKAMDALNNFSADFRIDESVDLRPLKEDLNDNSFVSYEFPKFTRRDKQVARNFNLEIVDDTSDDSTVVVGDYGKIKAFAHDYLAYELVDEYLTLYEGKNTELKEEIILNSVKNFRPSAEASETLKQIREADKLTDLDDIIAKMFPEEDPNADDINNLLINEKEWLFDMLNITEEK